MKTLNKTLAALLAATMTMALIVIPASAETLSNSYGSISFTPPSSPWVPKPEGWFSVDGASNSAHYWIDHGDWYERISVSISKDEDSGDIDVDNFYEEHGKTENVYVNGRKYNADTLNIEGGQVWYRYTDGTSRYNIMYSSNNYYTENGAIGNPTTEHLDDFYTLLDSVSIVDYSPAATPAPSSSSSTTTTTTSSSSRLEIVEYTGPRAIKIYVNESQVYPDSNPIIVNDRTLVPIRAIAEAMGYDVGWNQAQQRVTITAYDGSGEIQIGIGEYSIALPYKSVPIDVAAMIYEDRTYIPVRAVAEALDARVEWDGDVHIYQW